MGLLAPGQGRAHAAVSRVTVLAPPLSAVRAQGSCPAL